MAREMNRNLSEFASPTRKPQCLWIDNEWPVLIKMSLPEMKYLTNRMALRVYLEDCIFDWSPASNSSLQQ